MGAEHFPALGGEAENPQFAFNFKDVEKFEEHSDKKNEAPQEVPHDERAEANLKSKKKIERKKPPFLKKKKKKRTPEEEVRFRDLTQKYLEQIQNSTSKRYEMLRMSNLRDQYEQAKLWAENEMNPPEHPDPLLR